MDLLWEKAREVGRLVAQSEEYKALKRADEALSSDRDTLALINRLNELQTAFAELMSRGQEPGDAERDEYERIAGVVQVSRTYQAYAAARENFDRQMMRVDEEIARGIQAGEQSRIILSS
jgi:cell fate (sporulation/competence/biofilm development) regulator YlbF (YheA/YmcA/DUF963 family)